MGVYIKGMEMPKDGEKLYMIAFSDGKACASYNPFEWHEVVPVPEPHGRLGDLDALLKSKDILDDIGWPEAYLPISTIEAAPTIIQAEGGKGC